MEQYITTRSYILLFILCGLVYFLGLLFPLMDPDANEYAGIAMRMYQHSDFINIISRSSITLKEYDYLDKPHLLFWLAAFSYKIFGLHDWAYRLPSLMFTLIATYSTFGLGRTLYNKEVGRMAALIFISSQAIMLANHDVRTDAILTGAAIFAIWQLAEFIKSNKLINVIAGATGIALGVATKGLIAVITAGSAILCFVVYLRRWRTFYNWKWLAGLFTFLIVLSPVFYSYYLQFDLHPEKFVNGAYGQSGIKFIFWTQSFERFAGNRSFVHSSDPFFFFHTLLWAILPWSLLVYISVFVRIKLFCNTRFKSMGGMELLTLGGILIVFLFMSASRFKLPHYLNILFPLFAVLSASYLDQLSKTNDLKMLRILEGIQLFTLGILLLLLLIVNGWFFPVNNIWVIAGGVILLSLLLFFIFRRREHGILFRIIVPSVLAILLLNFMLNTNFYPKLLKYQAGNEMAKIAAENNIPTDQTFIYGKAFYSFDFYSKKTIPDLSLDQIQQKNNSTERFYLFVTDVFKKDVDHLSLHVTHTFMTPQYYVTRLKLKFLNPFSRSETLGKAYLLQVN
ncbi:MAG: family glycosyltransferase, 4-amino-4-deoxy-L-arabinose transferase [Bacteroidota bacterium]|nr:family glycosyltransferase, 4-amino-4-deoxy-L-arabinose transferase [Bacteroidota bacterium]